MPIGSGLNGQLGIANEVTPGTRVAVTTFNKYNTEKLAYRGNDAQGKGLGGDLVPLAARRQRVTYDGGGPVNFNLTYKGMGKWLEAMLGSYDAVASQIGVTGAYQQIHNVGSADGKSFTAQAGMPGIDGTIYPKTLGGCKITDWTLSADPNAIATIDATIDAMNMTDSGAGADALQAASYVAVNPEWAFNLLNIYTFAAYTTVSGLITPTTPQLIQNVRKATLKGSMPKASARWVAGQATKQEALGNDFGSYSGTLDLDLSAQSKGYFDQYIAGTPIGLLFSFVGPVIGGANSYTVNFAMPACFYDPDPTPAVGGPDVLTPTFPFTALKDANGNSVQGTIISTDTTV